MTTDLSELVRRATDGDEHAFGCLIERFQDYAVACAIGYGVDADEARDVAQEAFLSLPSVLPDLRVPQAFPVWFRRLIRTYALRHLRNQRHVDLGAEVPERPAAEPARRIAGPAVDGALRHLTPAQRMVVALQYFASLSQPEVAEFLAIPLSTVKKRAHDARAELRKVLPVIESSGRTSAPSRTSAFAQTIQLFAAIRRRDVTSVKRLLADSPGLVQARKSWTVEDGLAAGVGASGSATPLVRAATAASPELLAALLDAGADIDAVCDCDTRESALWAAPSRSPMLSPYGCSSNAARTRTNQPRLASPRSCLLPCAAVTLSRRAFSRQARTARKPTPVAGQRPTGDHGRSPIEQLPCTAGSRRSTCSSRSPTATSSPSSPPTALGSAFSSPS